MKSLKRMLCFFMLLLAALLLAACGEDEHAHSMEHFAEVPATCTEEGAAEYWYCSGCENYFSDENGDTRVERDELVIAKTAHAYGAWKELIAAGCETDGLRERACVCGRKQEGVIPAAHSYNSNNYCTQCNHQLQATEGLSFVLNGAGDGYILTGAPLSATDLVIPYYYDDGTNGTKPVVAVAAEAFRNQGNRRSLLLPATVREIGEYAFYLCTGLAEVRFDGAAESITLGASAFEGCSALSRVVLSDAVSVIGNRAFAGCLRLREVQIRVGSALATIGDYAFAECVGLLSFTLPEGLEAIGENAFAECYKLIEIYNFSTVSVTAGEGEFEDVQHVYASADTPSRLHADGEYVFYRAANGSYLVSYTGAGGALTLPESDGSANYAIYPYAFYGLEEITSVAFSAGVLSVGERAFAYCTELAAVDLQAAVAMHTVGNAAFYFCRDLEEIALPAALALIGKQAFAECNKLSATFGTTEGWFAAQSLDATGGTAITLSTPAQNALLLTDTYNNVYWKRTVA